MLVPLPPVLPLCCPCAVAVAVVVGVAVAVAVAALCGVRPRSALMRDEPRAATIVCETDCVLYALSADNFRELIGTVSHLQNQVSAKNQEYQRMSASMPAGSSGGIAGFAGSPVSAGGGAGEAKSASGGVGSGRGSMGASYRLPEDDEPPIQRDELDTKRVLGTVGAVGAVREAGTEGRQSRGEGVKKRVEWSGVEWGKWFLTPSVVLRPATCDVRRAWRGVTWRGVT
jgi:hypothetical protein